MVIDLPTVGGSRNQWGTWTNEILIRRGVDPTWSRFGLSATGTEAANATAWANADGYAAETGDWLRVPDIEAPLGAVTSTVPVEGRGPDRTVFTRSTGGGTATITVAGSYGTAVALSADAASGATSVTTASNPGLSAGDLVLITSERLPWGGTAKPDWDLHHVAAVSGSGPYTITLMDPLLRAFATADTARIRKVTGSRARLLGFGIRITGGAQASGINLTDGSVGAEIAGVDIDGYYERGIQLFAAVGARVSDCTITDPSDVTSGNGYGVSFRDGTRDSVIERARGRANRHLTIMTRGASYNTVRDSHGYDSDYGDFDQHGHQCRYITYIGCHAHNQDTGFSAGNTSYGGDYDTTYIRCTVNGVSASGDVGGFRAVAGAINIVYRDCERNGGRRGVEAKDSANVVWQGGALRDQAVYGALFTNTVGGGVIGARVRNAGTNAVASTGTSDYLRVTNNDFEGGGATKTALSGANNVTANNVSR